MRQSLDFAEAALGLHSQVRAFCPFPVGGETAFLWGGPSNILLDVHDWLLPTREWKIDWCSLSTRLHFRDSERFMHNFIHSHKIQGKLEMDII